MFYEKTEIGNEMMGHEVKTRRDRSLFESIVFIEQWLVLFKSMRQDPRSYQRNRNIGIMSDGYIHSFRPTVREYQNLRFIFLSLKFLKSGDTLVTRLYRL